MGPLEQVRHLRQTLPPATPENHLLREQMLLETRKLLLGLERPDNAVERICFQLLETVAVSTAIKMGLLKALNPHITISTDQLAKKCAADPVLVGQYWQTLPHGTADRGLELLTPGWLAIPSFLQENKWQNPTNPTDTPIAEAYNRLGGAHVWEILSLSPHLHAFSTYMATFNEGHRDWTEFYPVLKRLGESARDDVDAVMMVDVGGGLGHQAINFKHNYPQLPGKFIVQDLPQALPDPRPEGIEYMAHDFTTEQPVKGARLYYLRYVPHDWSQEQNMNLCIQLRKAMKPGYSRLIVNERVLPETGATRFMTSQDLNMLSANAGMERTAGLHREYLEAAGLKIVNIYNPNDQISEAVIEAEAV